MLTRLFAWMLGHRRTSLLVLLIFTGLLGSQAVRVKPDFRIEHLFPAWDSARVTYDRFKTQFPFEDNRVLVMVQADDLFTGDGLRRLGALEEDLRSIANVLDVEGPTTSNDIVEVDDTIAVQPLFPSPDLPPAELAERARRATTDPLFKWSLASPDGKITTIRVTLTPSAGADDAARARFLLEARALVRQHEHPGQRIVLSGLPVIRASYTEMILKDGARLSPLALLVVMLLLFVAFRSLGAVLSGIATILAAITWTYGVMGMLGYPMTMIGGIVPVVVMIISLSDTVHVVNDFTARRREGLGVHDALVHAMVEAAVPCLLTEIVLACGFFSLIAINIVAIVQFGVATALGMLLTWLANMTVLPLCLSLTRGGVSRRSEQARQETRAPWAVRTFARFVDWIAHVVEKRPRRVAIVAACIFIAAAVAGTRVRRISYAFDDLRPGQPLFENLRFAEKAHGGLVPVAIFIEATPGERSDAPVFDPEVVRLADRAAAILESHAEIPQATSLADPLRKTHGLLTGDTRSGALPTSRSLIAQEVSLFDDGKMLRELVSFDRRAIVAIGWSRDAGSDRTAAILRDIDAWAAREQAVLDARADGPRMTIRVTGQLRLFDDVNQMLLAGLIGSLGGALLVTVLVFCIVLRSWRLGLIGLIPNISPLVIVLAMMWLADVPLRPVTVVAFSVTLVIADDDTIQFLARFRSHFARARARFAGQPDVNLHREAALTCMREVGLPMFVTSTAVSAGFLMLLGAQMTGTAHLGMIIGTTLFAAVFADLFLTPLLLSWLRPRV